MCREAAETVAALEAERNDLALRAAVIDEALTNAIQMRKQAETERDEARAELRLFMLAQPTTDERNTYSDGFAQGLAYSISKIDAALDALTKKKNSHKEF